MDYTKIEPTRKLVQDGTMDMHGKSIEVTHVMYEYRALNIIERLNIWYQKDLDIVLDRRYDHFHYKDPNDYVKDIENTQDIMIGEVNDIAQK